MKNNYFQYGLIGFLFILAFVVGGIAVSQEKEVKRLEAENQAYKEDYIAIVDEFAGVEAYLDYVQRVEEMNKQLIERGMFITFDGEIFYYVTD